MGAVRNRTVKDERGSLASVVAIGCTWMVLIVLVLSGTMELRDEVRSQILSRDGHILTAMARVQTGVEDDPDERDILAEEPLAIFLHLASREGIIAAWLYDRDAEPTTRLPMAYDDRPIPPEAKPYLAEGKPFSRYLPEFVAAKYLLDPESIAKLRDTQPIPAVEVFVPLRGGGGGEEDGGTAGFVIEASGLAEQFRALDRRLAAQASLVLVLAMGLTGVPMGVAFRRLERARRLLAQRTEGLLRANRELGRATRVAALGAVTAHLVHGLKNPMSGLRNFVASRGGSGQGGEEEWHEAKEAADRMQSLIHEVVQVIREKEAEMEYEVPLKELADWVVAQARPLAERKGIRLLVEGSGNRSLDNRVSGLLSLILRNLVENAIEATRDGGAVKLHLLEEGGAAACEVVDEGAGIPVAMWERLFQPQSSTKEGGTGLGLAITRQLALAMGGDVRLQSSDAHGTTFRVEMPVLSEKGEMASGVEDVADGGTGAPVRR